MADQNAWSGIESAFSGVGDSVRFMYEGVEFWAKIEADETANIDHLYNRYQEILAQGDLDRSADKAEFEQLRDDIAAWERGQWGYIAVVVGPVANRSVSESFGHVRDDASYDALRRIAMKLADECLPQNQPKWDTPCNIQSVSTLGCVMAVVMSELSFDQIRAQLTGHSYLQMAGIPDEVTLKRLRQSVREIISEYWSKSGDSYRG